MTKAEKIELIVLNANKATDVPALGEETEGKVLTWIANRTLVHLPDRALDAILNVSDGLTDNEIGMLTDVVTSFLNQAVDVPYVPERVEEVVIRQGVAWLLSKAREGQTVIAA